VPGDVVRIEAGDRVQADGTLAFGQGVTVDESILTGESLPVDKGLGGELFSGTLLVKGKGYMEVTGTGSQSNMGRLATMIGTIEAGKTPLERRLGEFGNQVALAILALGLVLTVGGVVVDGIGRLGQVFLFSVALAVAAVPEGLPVVLTLTLALGVERLAGRKAIVRRLSAVESLGSVTVIATDKTGTLTENRMHVRALHATDPTRALHAMVLANDAEIGSRIGDPLETALLDHAQSQGMNAQLLVRSRPRTSSRPFDSTCKFMRATVEEDGAGKLFEGRARSADRAEHARRRATARLASQGCGVRSSRPPGGGAGAEQGGKRGGGSVPGARAAVGSAAAGGARRNPAREGRRHSRPHDHRRSCGNGGGCRPRHRHHLGPRAHGR
jgi:Ca2+-transporting ATPase